VFGRKNWWGKKIVFSLGVSKKIKKPIKPRKPEKKIIEKTEP
jgi:hypothetical protein